MGDFLLTAEGDMDFSNGKISFTNDIGQKIKIHLNSFLGEWFLDRDYGVPYFQSIFHKRLSKENIDSIFTTQIQNIDGVKQIISFYSNLKNRIYSYNVKVLTTEEQVVSVEGQV